MGDEEEERAPARKVLVLNVGQYVGANISKTRLIRPGAPPFSAGKAASARPQGPSKPPARVPRASDAVTCRFVALICRALPVKLAGRGAKASYTARPEGVRGLRKPPAARLGLGAPRKPASA